MKKRENGGVIILNGAKKSHSRKGVTITISKKQLEQLNISPEDVEAAVYINSKKEEEKGKDKKISFKKLAVIAIPLVMLITCISSCAKANAVNIDNAPKIITEPISGIVYQIDYPEEHWESLTSIAGQEEMTWGATTDENAFNNEHYSWEEQAIAEQLSSQGISNSIELRKEIENSLQIIGDANSSQEQKYVAAKRLKEIYGVIEEAYISNHDFAQEQVDRFKEASTAIPDVNTENEIQVINEIFEKYKIQIGLTNENINLFNTIIKYYENGYEINGILIEETARGDYLIEGQATITVGNEENEDQHIITREELRDLVEEHDGNNIPFVGLDQYVFEKQHQPGDDGRA